MVCVAAQFMKLPLHCNGIAEQSCPLEAVLKLVAEK